MRINTINRYIAAIVLMAVISMTFVLTRSDAAAFDTAPQKADRPETVMVQKKAVTPHGPVEAVTLAAVDPVEPEPETAQEPQMELLGTYWVTGYDPYCAHCCGKSDGITASGTEAVTGYTVSMKDIPFGTVIYIDGLGTFEVQDRGVGAGVIDVACDSHAACYAITGNYEVWVVDSE